MTAYVPCVRVRGRFDTLGRTVEKVEPDGHVDQSLSGGDDNGDCRSVSVIHAGDLLINYKPSHKEIMKLLLLYSV
jgi:hypothetical protein